MADVKKGHSIWTPANIVTCIRVVFVPVWLLMAELLGGKMPTEGISWGMFAVFVAFCLLSLTDKLDGYLARSRNEVTTFGKFLDPIADKLVVIVSLCYLLERGEPVTWPLLVIVSREFLVSGLRMVVASKGVVIAASDLGKWKTATTMGAICANLLALALPADTTLHTVLINLAYAALFVAVLLTIWSGVDYFMKAWGSLVDEEPADEAGAESSPLTWDDVTKKAEGVLEAARAKGLTIGTAESCTGGLVEGALTAIPGSSDVVMGAVGSYACSVKEALLGVSHETLERVGAVSSECASEMAAGARRALDCDVAVSVTGIAGPGGAVPGKPVGLVWFGLSFGDEVRTVSEVFEGNRDQVRLQSVIRALELVSEAL